VSIAILDPAAPPVHGRDDEPTHYWCCSEDTALCGADLTDAEPVDVDDDARDCPLCLYVLDEDLACPVAGCAVANPLPVAREDHR
jgi:hypothetical protein